MVGSGFSQHAVPSPLTKSKLPTWDEVIHHFHTELYPQHYGPGSKSEPETNQTKMRIAQEYATAYGRSSLNETMGRLISNDEFNPSLTHQRLLSLPWRDIYTTNWDTLLEKSQCPSATSTLQYCGKQRTNSDRKTTPHCKITRFTSR